MDGKKSIQELTVAFDRALVAAGYSESRLTNFRTVIKRLLIFGAAQGIECYSSSVGKKFLEKCYPVEFDGRLVHELPCTTQYAWRTITLLNDFNTHGAFFRARRLRGNLQLTTEFQNLSDEFGDDCRGKGTSEATVYRRQADLRKFFNYLHSNKIAMLKVRIISLLTICTAYLLDSQIVLTMIAVQYNQHGNLQLLLYIILTITAICHFSLFIKKRHQIK